MLLQRFDGGTDVSGYGQIRELTVFARDIRSGPSPTWRDQHWYSSDRSRKEEAEPSR